MSAPLTREFLDGLRRRTEERWAAAGPRPGVLGFQFARGTRWLPGLPPDRLAAYEAALGARFPDDLRLLLSALNGTEPAGVYSYPRDLDRVRGLADAWRADRAGIARDLAEQGAPLAAGDVLVPLFGHRAAVCGADPRSCRVLSVVEGDSVVYAGGLRAWLERELLEPDRP